MDKPKKIIASPALAMAVVAAAAAKASAKPVTREFDDKIETRRLVLESRSMETTEEEVKEKKLYERLCEMFGKGWVESEGWAAIQIGVPLRYAVYRIGGHAAVLLNPVLLEWSGYAMMTSREGCMSLPYERHITYRYTHVTIENGPADKRVILKAEGREAWIIQHEMDHMDGILCDKRTTIQNRNEPCECGSGVKFKKCHGR